MIDNFTLYITLEHPCPYLADRHAINLLIDPNFVMRPKIYADLLNQGFRRSGHDVYRPHCKLCKECISTRIPVEYFHANRSQRRNWQRNQDLHIRYNTDNGLKPEYDVLYHRYVQERHKGGGMDDANDDSYQNFLTAHWCPTVFIEFWLDTALVGVATTDKLKNGLSLVYTFYDPEVAKQRGLGTFALLTQIEYAKQLGLPYVYPGYWIAHSPKMNYKTRFRPIEGLVDGHWQNLETLQLP